MEEIPVINLSSILNSSTEESWIEIGKQLQEAFHKIGFVYLLNHGIDSEKIQKAFTASKQFFEQPLQQKRLYQFENSPKGYHGHGQGYRINDETGNDNGRLFELRESFDITGKLRPLGDDSEGFISSLLSLQEECKPVVKVILKLLGIGLLGMEESEYFLNCSKWLDDNEIPSFKTFRSLYYPAIPKALEIPEGHARVKEHSDFDFITLLFQDSIGGLQVKTATGEWIEAPYIPGSVIVNIGDLLEAWSGRYFPATKHRVLIPESEIKKRICRQSIAYFLHPDSNTLVAPIPSKILGDYSFTPFKAYEHTKAKLAGVRSY